jgi:predicted metal-dependent enzyme (double-stranded beta helix superfamily)
VTDTITSPRPSATAFVPRPVLPPAPREIARSLAERTALWRPLVRFDDPRFYARIATGPDWEAWLLTWLPGQSTGLHDHGGSRGAFAVLAGAVDEDVPVRRNGAPVRLRTRRYGAGQVRAFGADHLHDVAARSGVPAVTLHVYAPRLEVMTRYALIDGTLAVTAEEREGGDW